MLLNIKRLILSLIATVGMDHLFRAINKRKIAILIYHGVTPECLHPPCSTQMSSQDFIWQMEYLKRYYHLIPLAEVIRKMAKSEPLPDNAAVVTFDDGFENNFTVAYPILKQLGIPAMMFLPTGYIGTDKVLWPQELYMILTATLLKQLDMTDYGMGKYDLSTMSRNTNVLTVNTQVIDDIRKSLMSFSEEKKEEILMVIRKRLCVEKPDKSIKDKFSMMTWAQVKEMNESGLISFGSHTRNHPFLINLNQEMLTQEIAASFETIRKELKVNDIYFAYTFGNRQDFSGLSKQVVRQQGALCALTTIQGLNDPGDDLFELKRVYSNVTKDAFKLAVSGCLPLLRKFKRSAY